MASRNSILTLTGAHDLFTAAYTRRMARLYAAFLIFAAV